MRNRFSRFALTGCWGISGWRLDRDLGPHALLALNNQTSAMQIDKRAGQWQSKPGSGKFARQSAFNLTKRRHDGFKIGLGDPNTRINHRYFNSTASQDARANGREPATGCISTKMGSSGFSGRSDDVFKVKGLWVSPIEVEAEITDHDAVLEAAVISFEDTDGLIVPKAFVVLRPGHEPSDALTEELKSSVQGIGGYKVPREIVYTDDLPRTTLLKIDRRALRLREASGAS